jgi:hypothetical protein
MKKEMEDQTSKPPSKREGAKEDHQTFFLIVWMMKVEDDH